MIAQTQTQIDGLREAGKRMKTVVDEVLRLVRPGVGSMELEEKAREVTKRLGAEPSYLGFVNKGEPPYPAALCVSVNNELVHSPPTPEKVLKSGDVVSVDFGLNYKGYFMDTAYTLAVGDVDAAAKNLIEGTREALSAAIEVARTGNTVGNIGAAVEAVAKRYKLSVVKDLRGHGVGNDVHEEPLVPNFGKSGKGAPLTEGMVLAIEPILTEGGGALMDGGDGFSVVSRDGSRGAHFEHTILITKNGAEILTL